MKNYLKFFIIFTILLCTACSNKHSDFVNVGEEYAKNKVTTYRNGTVTIQEDSSYYREDMDFGPQTIHFGTGYASD